MEESNQDLHHAPLDIENLTNQFTKKKPISARSIDLEVAIETLQKLACYAERQGATSLEEFAISDGRLISKRQSPIEKSLSLTKQWILRHFFRTRRQSLLKDQEEVKLRVLQSVDTLKIHLSAIERMKRGTHTQQQLAELVLATAKQYNQLVYRIRHKPSSWPEKVKRFFLKAAGSTLEDELIDNDIYIPQDTSLQFNVQHSLTYSSHKLSQRLSAASSQPLTEKISQLFPKTTSESDIIYLDQPKPYEIDAFRMKAISMIQNQQEEGMLSQTLKSLKQGKLIAKLYSSNNNEPSQSPILSLTQVITPLPGEEILVEGAFLRNSQHPDVSIPIPDSFRLSSTAVQNGFPHPSQHITWGLGEKLIPPYPFKPSLMPKTAALLRLKEETARNLLPKGLFNQKAKYLLELRKKTFEESPDIIWTGLKSLIKLFSSSSCSTLLEVSPESIIEQFFDETIKNPNAFEIFSQAHEHIATLFIKKPYEELHHECLLGEYILSTTPCHHNAFNLAKSMIDKHIQESKQLLINERDNATTDYQWLHATYQLILGQCLAQSSALIISQNLSELLGYQPPILTDFAQRILLSALIQVKEFTEELNTPWEIIRSEGVNWMRQHYQNLFTIQTTLFTSKEVDKSIHPECYNILNEIIHYYNR